MSNASPSATRRTLTGAFAEVADDATGLRWIDKRLPDGRGVRLNLDYSFKGFID